MEGTTGRDRFSVREPPIATQRLMFMRFIVVAVSLAVMTACSGSPDTVVAESPSSESPDPATVMEIGDDRERRTETEVFGGLSVELVVPSAVESGAEVPTRLRVANRSDGPLTDPGCALSSGRYALIPVDDVSAELWVQPVVDCGGPYTYEVGAAEEYDGPGFIAASKLGEPLPPGRYLAAWEVNDQRLEYPITVTAP